jgi:peroxiredoxin
MMKVTKFMFIVLFLLSFTPGCKPADKVIPEEPFKETEKITTSEFPLAYEFKLNDLKGGDVSLSSYKEKKVVVLIFWTTWCPYCREALKSLQADFKSLDDMGVELLAINTGEPKDRVNRFAQSFNFSFRVLLDQDASVADHYDLFGVPTYFIINKSGQIVFSGNRFAKERLKELTAK